MTVPGLTKAATQSRVDNDSFQFLFQTTLPTLPISGVGQSLRESSTFISFCLANKAAVKL